MKLSFHFIVFILNCADEVVVGHDNKRSLSSVLDTDHNETATHPGYTPYTPDHVIFSNDSSVCILAPEQIIGPYCTWFFFCRSEKCSNLQGRLQMSMASSFVIT